MKKFSVLIILVLLSAQLTTGQTLVNTEWVKVSSYPDSIGLSASVIDVWGNIVVTGNTYDSAQQANIVTTKYDGEGEIVWQVEWNGPQNGSDYAGAITTDSEGNIYVAGASNYGNDSTFDIVILKYRYDGYLLWMETYNGTGGDDFPVEIALYEQEYIYVVGGSEGINSGMDYITLKLDLAGDTVWTARYDYNQLVDIAAGLTFDGENVIVTGGSESSAGVWDYTTLFYDMDGNQEYADREPSDDTDLRTPKGVVKDDHKNYYITGIKHNGTDYDIKILKLDSTLSPIWIKVYHQESEGSNAIAIDADGAIYIGGWLQSPTKRDFLLLKYSSSGDLIWEKNISPSVELPFSQVTHLKVSGEIVLITGTASDGYSSQIVTAQYDTSGYLYWTQNWQVSGKEINFPTDIEQLGDDVYVTGKSVSDSGSKFITVKYTSYTRDSSKVYEDTVPTHFKNQLIVRFDPSVVKREAVDNSEGKIANFGYLDYFLKENAVDSIQSRLAEICISNITGGPGQQSPGSGCDITMVKIFPELKTTDTLTTSRLGEQIRVPSFWTAFVLEFPEGTNIGLVAAELEGLFPIVRYVHPNIFGSLFGAPNDQFYPVQSSLHSTSAYTNAHINVEPAWGITAGASLSFVKVGILDWSVAWRHEDFGSRFIDGWDYDFNKSVKRMPYFYGNHHATAPAGIIGARKNNTRGVAGIAGGVSLYNANLVQEDTTGGLLNLVFRLDWAAHAIFNMAKDSANDPTNPIAYGLHIMNMSWGTHVKDPDTVRLLRDALHFAHKLKVTLVAAGGNDGLSSDSSLRYGKSIPANIDSNWILNVGGAGTDGEYLYGPLNDGGSYWAANTGSDIDVVAPAASANIFTTSNTTDSVTNEYNQYASFSRTSASAPHVAGVAALLIGYLNSSGNHYQNLAPEDVEFIITRTAKDVGDAGKDTLTGYGRLNAGAALQYVEKPARSLYHYGTLNSNHSTTINLYSQNDTVSISEQYENEDDIVFKKGKYLVNTFEINSVIKPGLPNSLLTVVAGWPVHSMSTVMLLYNSNNVLLPREKIYLDSFNIDSAFLRGYIYEVSDTNGNFLGWWPQDTSVASLRLVYTLLLHNNSYPWVGIKENNRNGINVFPNPAIQEQTITIELNSPENISLQLFDMNGRHIKRIYEGRALHGETAYKINFSGLSGGIYICQIKIGSEIYFRKLIKLSD